MKSKNRNSKGSRLEEKLSKETELEESDRAKSSLYEKAKYAGKNWAIDTSAKIAVFAPLMGAMEAYNGLDAEQIVGARATSALVDTFVARAYTKTADYLCKKLSVDPKKGGIKAWAIDTASMIGTYAPVYTGILYANGANHDQVISANVMAAAIATITSRPFRKYVLFPWRKFCGFKSK
jgi:hypothetical protein